MQTYYKFVLPCDTAEMDLGNVLIEHFEKVTLLVDLFSGSRLIAPNSISFDVGRVRNRSPLFSDPKKHIWHQTRAVRTKDVLKAERSDGDVDGSYDIDVLRMTEPRIVFIRDTLELINQLPLPERKVILGTKNDTSLNGVCDIDSSDIVSSAFASHLGDLASKVWLYDDEARVQPTGYRFRRARNTASPTTFIMRDPVENVFSNFLIYFHKIIELEFSANQIRWFALKSYEHWLEPSQGEPFEILGTLSRDCNAKCDFCYVLGNPSNTAIKLQRFSNEGSADEARTRLSFFERGLKLPIPTYDTEEITTHPAFLDTCTRIRSISSKCISITTNGYRLDERTLLKLKSLAPIDISLSLNATSPDTRRWLMGGAYSRGLAALDLLHKHEIPCAVTLVAWPRVSFEETIRSIRYIDGFNVRSISVLLGGYTKLFPNPPTYPIPGFWNEAIDALHLLRNEIETPLIIQPRLYEEYYRLGDAIGRNIVTGINKYSPAKQAGVRVYDEIIAINENPMSTRNECLAILRLLRERTDSIDIVVLRNGKESRLTLDGTKIDPRYIYGKPFNDRFGLHLFGENLPIGAIKTVYEVVARHRAKNVLIATSLIVRPFLIKMLEQLSFLTEENISFDLQIVPNDFLGGNIVMGDMLVIDDFYGFLQTYLRENDCDLVLIPSGPFNHGGWLRDMKGQSFELLRRMISTPIEMIEANYFE